jgi:uncharacterized protein (DUF2141 family)
LRRFRIIAGIPAALLLLQPAHANEAVCKPQKVKKVSQLCVAVSDQSGAADSNVHLRVFDADKQIAEGVTGSDGKFSFEDLKAGSYQVKVHADGFQDDVFPIVVTSTGKKCKRAVQILLYVGWLPCLGEVRLVKK